MPSASHAESLPRLEGAACARPDPQLVGAATRARQASPARRLHGSTNRGPRFPRTAVKVRRNRGRTAVNRGGTVGKKRDPRPPNRPRLSRPAKSALFKSEPHPRCGRSNLPLSREVGRGGRGVRAAPTAPPHPPAPAPARLPGAPPPAAHTVRGCPSPTLPRVRRESTASPAPACPRQASRRE